MDGNGMGIEVKRQYSHINMIWTWLAIVLIRMNKLQIDAIYFVTVISCLIIKLHCSLYLGISTPTKES